MRDGKRASAIVQHTRNMLVKGATADEPIDLQRLSLEVGELLERELSANRIHLKVEFSGRDSTIKANRVDMQQVLVNLITNGMQAIVDTEATVREIDVSIDQPNAESVRLSVRDHGPGISEDDLAKLFNPFFTTKAERDGDGTGHQSIRHRSERRRPDCPKSSGRRCGLRISATNLQGRCLICRPAGKLQAMRRSC